MLGKGTSRVLTPIFIVEIGYFLLLGSVIAYFKILKKALIKEMGDMSAFSQIFSRSVAQNGRALSHLASSRWWFESTRICYIKKHYKM